MEKRSHHEARGHGKSLRLASQGRHELGAFARSHICGWKETVLWASFGHGRWRQHSGCGGEVMRGYLMAAILATAWLPGSLSAQSAARGSGKTPRTREGKPDLTGVWQGGSNTRGTWEEANAGTGVGGTGRDPSAPVALSSNDRPAGREGAPYQPWAAQKVLESFHNRGIDDPAALCLPLGLPRLPMLGLFPLQIVQTPTQIVILYEYMSVFRVIPLNAAHPDDILPSYMGNSVGHWEGDTLVVDVTG